MTWPAIGHIHCVNLLSEDFTCSLHEHRLKNIYIWKSLSQTEYMHADGYWRWTFSTHTIHSPQFDLAVVGSGYQEGQGWVEGHPVNSPVMALKYVLHCGVGSAKQFRLLRRGDFLVARSRSYVLPSYAWNHIELMIFNPVQVHKRYTLKY